MNRPKARRDFILDSGGLSHLANSEARTIAWFEEIAQVWDAPAIFVPLVVMSECLTGNPRHDAKTHRLLKRIEAGAGDEGHWLHPTLASMSRASVLRTQAIKARANDNRPISAIDAQVVALAEERSAYRAVTILTTDAADIQLLVDLTRRPNLSVMAL